MQVSWTDDPRFLRRREDVAKERPVIVWSKPPKGTGQLLLAYGIALTALIANMVLVDILLFLR